MTSVLVCPGDRLCAAGDDGSGAGPNVAGPGTFARGAYIQASLLGVRRDEVQADGSRVVSVVARDEMTSGGDGGSGIVLPEVGDVVMCRWRGLPIRPKSKFFGGKFS